MFVREEISQDESTFAALSPKYIIHLSAPCHCCRAKNPNDTQRKTTPLNQQSPLFKLLQPTILQRLLYSKQFLNKISQILKKILETPNTRDFQCNNRF